MLDVHPPHQAAHTWQDFFIHIATICIGLLIAIGLEQTVELVHHRHQRHQLIEAMHAESERTVEIMDLDMKAFNNQSLVLQAILRVLTEARVEGNRITFVPPPDAAIITAGQIPPHSVWPIAKSNGTAALLPENIAEVYTRLDFEADQFMAGEHELEQANDAVSATAIGLQLSFKPGVKVSMTPAERDQVVHVIAVNVAKLEHEKAFVANWAGAAEAVAHNVQSRDEMTPYMLRRLKNVP